MNNQIRWLRISYWTGAVIDAYVAVELSAQFLKALNGSPGQWSDYQTAVGVAAGLMWGWTCLLLWADRKPLERRGVLLLTVFPVVVALGLHELAALLRGLITLADAARGLLIRPILIILFVTSYWNARNADERQHPIKMA